MSDDDIIQQAYVLQLQQVFKVYVDSLATGNSKETAETRFKKGMKLAREARDKALAMVKHE